MFMDNSSDHENTEALKTAADSNSPKISVFPMIETHLVQPYDSFTIQKIETAWTHRWVKHKRARILQNKWTNSSGKLIDPGKGFFLRLGADSIKVVKNEKDEDGIQLARKAMICCGLAKNRNNNWEVRQLFRKLQMIIAKHRKHF